MEKRNSKKEDEVDEVVDTLLDLPVKNLEERIKQLETEIQMRAIIRNGALSSFGTHQLRLEEKLRQIHYRSAINSSALARKTALDQEMVRTEFRKIDEWLEYFKDVIKLQDDLQQAREELALEKEKRRLLE